MGGEDAGHVGVEVWNEAVEADVCFGEADELFAIECAEDLAAGVMGDDEGGGRLDVEFGFGPDFAGDFDAAVEFVECVEMADGDIGHGSYEFSVIGFKFRKVRTAFSDQRPGGKEEASVRLGDKTQKASRDPSTASQHTA